MILPKKNKSCINILLREQFVFFYTYSISDEFGIFMKLMRSALNRSVYSCRYLADISLKRLIYNVAMFDLNLKLNLETFYPFFICMTAGSFQELHCQFIYYSLSQCR